ncbi:hypothetical protein VQ7734_04833 [Vibrio quintilis]|uniref:Uncharacterized protein n=1 Tax=Vibrio quintilis TaxID=1117707 RepID=A0A1M7Z262_9VIBR|nr:hypothetical protein VQ7734_04833 [Vibrio quintilis]
MAWLLFYNFLYKIGPSQEISFHALVNSYFGTYTENVTISFTFSERCLRLYPDRTSFLIVYFL